MSETRHSLRIKEHDDGTVTVQIDGKSSSCGHGSTVCAFKRSLDWLKDGETHGPEECFRVDA